MIQRVRKASVLWEGGRTRSKAKVSTEGGIFKPAEFLLSAAHDLNADAAELVAAAYAMSFCVALAHELALKPFTRGRIIVTAAATVARSGAEGRMITKVRLDVGARLPGTTQEAFIDATLRAKASCVVSRSLRANVAMHAKLEDTSTSVARRVLAGGRR